MGSMQVCILEGGGLFHLVHAVADCIDEQGDHKGEKRLLPHVSIMNFSLLRSISHYAVDSVPNVHHTGLTSQ